MPTKKLTQLAVDRLQPPKEGRSEYFDTHLPGFGLRISATGGRSWIVFYRVNGKQHRYTIGTLATVPKVDDARERAREIMVAAERGIDLAEAKSAAPAKRLHTVENLSNEFIQRYAKPKNRSWQETERLLQRHVESRWGSRDATSITRRDIMDLIDALVEGGHPVGANRVLAAVRKMFGWAVERDILPTSPVVNVKAPGKEIQRERVLSDAELVTVWRGTEAIGASARAFVRLLILTGQRRSEVANMRWIDLDLSEKVWTLPRERTKGDRTHEIPLSDLAIETISTLPRLGTFVLTSRGFRRLPAKPIVEKRLTDRDRPVSGYSKIKAALDANVANVIERDAVESTENSTELAAWRFHDLRRTVGTGMARAGIPVSVISRVMNHKEGGVTQIYNRYSYLDEKRCALETWARKVESLIRPKVEKTVTDCVAVQ